MEADVLEEHDVSRPQRPHTVRDILADRVRNEGDVAAEELAEALRHRRERELRVASFRPTEMRDERHGGAAISQQADRRQRRTDSRLIGDGSLFERDVEIDANEDALSFRIQVPHRALPERHAPLSERLRRAPRGPARPVFPGGACSRRTR